MRTENIPSYILHAVKVNERNPKENEDQYTLRVMGTVIKLIEQEISKERGYSEYQQAKSKHLFTNPEGQRIIVHHKDLPSFCKAFHLSEQEMIRVSNGEIESHKKYSRPYEINPEFVGSSWQKPKDYTAILKKGKDEIASSQAYHKANPQYVMPPDPKPPIVYTPSL